ncbi:MAG: hypothetical protein HY541_04665 [Deltaproteobacteria bacterium]|nr:hypothetical protein [Deltaproteobacteria bacterium]
MPIDPIDTAREDAQRSEKKKDSDRVDRRRQGEAFQVKIRQSQLKAKETREKDNASRDGKQGEAKTGEDIFHHVLSVFRGKEESQGEGKREADKKDDSKKDKLHEEKGESTRFKSVSEEGHSRVAAKESHHQGGGADSGTGSGSSGGGGGGGGSGSAGGQGGGGGSFSGSQGGRSDQGFSGKKDIPSKGGATSAGGRSARISFTAGIGGQGAGKRGFSTQNLDQMVEAVFVGLNNRREEEMEVHLSDEYFSGLKLKATNTSAGVVITFLCPNADVKKMFLLNRPQIYARFKEKKISVHRVDIV